MKVLLKYRSNSRILEEIVELIQGEVSAFGTILQVPDNHTMFEDEEGLWALCNDDIIEIKPLKTIPKFSDN